VSDPALPRVLAEAIAELTRRALEQERRGEVGKQVLTLHQGPEAVGAALEGPHGRDRKTWRVTLDGHDILNVT
jgi:hypothetical protein